MKIELIEDWQKSLKLFSQQANTVGVALSTGYVSMYDKLKDNFSPQWMAAITAVIFALGFIGRIISQAEKADNETDTTPKP